MITDEIPFDIIADAFVTLKMTSRRWIVDHRIGREQGQSSFDVEGIGRGNQRICRLTQCSGCPSAIQLNADDSRVRSVVEGILAILRCAACDARDPAEDRSRPTRRGTAAALSAFTTAERAAEMPYALVRGEGRRGSPADKCVALTAMPSNILRCLLAAASITVQMMVPPG